MMPPAGGTAPSPASAVAAAAYVCSVMDNACSPRPERRAHAEAYLTLATLQAQSGDLASAEPSYRRALALSPVEEVTRTVLSGLIDVLQRLGKNRQAEIFTEKLAKQDEPKVDERGGNCSGKVEKVE
ncbi:hypothetical protein AMAG_15076 [Allomyces macrogynus ATCC 38327]|uniref:Uncharacterized protein n=1 Tax=Allomyces macrogynus (strain ATCC 38327) TaxID=578462 RepID=A0A0L0T5Y3_ALLM3|nr:hypothetical protein AMAG_15076 [Allomyces macrogynus ATCC 38327]|eukprot:KNE70096.1 hypothetical protein AMAG_15076 [Allomyces macrogynus ATCC 38327]